MVKGLAWECFCGHIEYEKFPPEDCSKCLRVGEFTKLSGEDLEEREAEAVLSSKGNYDEDDEEFEDDED